MVKELKIDAIYDGKYVALKSRKEEHVISFGDDPKKVFDEAKQKGIENPVIVFVPKADSIYIYSCTNA
jgi:hypothetical protein